MKLLPYLPFLALATAAALPAGGPTKDPVVRTPEEKFAHAKEQCNRLVGKRREVCLRSLHHDHGSNLVLVTKGISKRDDGEDEFGEMDGGGRKKMMVANVSPDGEKVIDVKNHQKRGIEVKADDDGVVDLAIPVKVSPYGSSGQVVQSDYQQTKEQQPSNLDDFAAPTSFFPAPTTLQTIALATPTPTQGHLPPIEIDNAITFAPSTTYPVQRILQTTTLANGTELRIEQTESDVHDVHVEETEHQKGAPEEDKVVVHVKVFVEHLRQQAEKGLGMIKRGLGLEAQSNLHARDVEATEKATHGNAFCKYTFMCSLHHKSKDDEDKDTAATKRDMERSHVQARDVAATEKATHCNAFCRYTFLCHCDDREDYRDGVKFWLGTDNYDKKKRDLAAVEATQEADQAAEDPVYPDWWEDCRPGCKWDLLCDCEKPKNQMSWDVYHAGKDDKKDKKKKKEKDSPWKMVKGKKRRDLAAVEATQGAD